MKCPKCQQENAGAIIVTDEIKYFTCFVCGYTIKMKFYTDELKKLLINTPTYE